MIGENNFSAVISKILQLQPSSLTATWIELCSGDMVAGVDGSPSCVNPARLSTTTTVTALALAGDIVLIGEGNVLKCYDRRDITSARLLATTTLFNSQAIHGLLAIQLCDAQHVVVAWGGAYLRVLVLEYNTRLEYAARLEFIGYHYHLTSLQLVLVCPQQPVD